MGGYRPARLSLCEMGLRALGERGDSGVRAFSGPAYDLTFCEVRDTSLVLLWKPPVYSGSSPVSGYFVDYKEEDSGEWLTVNEVTTPHRYLKVTQAPQALSSGEWLRQGLARGPQGLAHVTGYPSCLPGVRDCLPSPDLRSNYVWGPSAQGQLPLPAAARPPLTVLRPPGPGCLDAPSSDD